MRFHFFPSLLAGTALISVSHADKCNFDLDITSDLLGHGFGLGQNGCTVIKPKVVIISMVSHFLLRTNVADLSSSNLKQIPGTPMLERLAQLAIS